MNLTPEEKQVGKQNFDEAVGTTRRDFLKGTVLAAGTVGAAGLGAAYFNYTPLTVDQRLRVGIIGTGDEGGVLIGALNPAYIDVVAIADIRPYSRYRAFNGDWYSPGAHAARPGLLEVYKDEFGGDEEKARSHVKVYENGYQELLDDPSVEAVIIALPLHLHHPAAIAAMRKGKHVLTEKLMGHNVAQCKEMARVARQTGLILAVGHQRHYSILYDNAVEQIKQGLIGDIHHIRAQWHRGNLPGNDSWQPPLPEPYDGYAAFVAEAKRLEVAKNKRDLDLHRRAHPLYAQLMGYENALADAEKKPDKPGIADLKQKIAQARKQMEDSAIKDEVGPKYGYESKMLSLKKPNDYERTPLEELIRWRLWDRTGGGLMAELGSHQLDASSIFISADHNTGQKIKPLSVTGVGGRHIFPADRDCDDHVYCTFEFPGKGYYDDDHKTVKDKDKKIVVTYSSINGNGFGGYGEIVMGTKGTLILEQEQNAMLFKGSDTATRIEVKAAGPGKAAMDTYETGGGAALAQVALSGGPPSRGYREEIEHWAWCIKNPAPEHKPHCTPEVAMADAIIALTSNLAIKKGERIEFVNEWFDVDSDETPEGDKPRQAEQVT